ncbi:hypothetical protein ABIC75_004239 [Dyella japonica]|uniref:Uncharacterized protein n=1 Tax=Dyella japonica TaxID=231455 RepID=A0ABV2K081_9GAMM
MGTVSKRSAEPCQRGHDGDLRMLMFFSTRHHVDRAEALQGARV